MKQEIELLRSRIKELEGRQAKYDNLHTQPSLRPGGRHKGRREQPEAGPGKPGQKTGHEVVKRMPGF